jgi:hypothetical protein
MLNFKNMLRRYEQPLSIISKAAGHWDDNTGQWIPGQETKINIKCPVVPLSNDDLIADEGGNYTQQDRKIYVHQKLKQGAEVQTGGHKYRVHAEKDYAAHASGLRIYVIVRKGEAGD